MKIQYMKPEKTDVFEMFELFQQLKSDDHPTTFSDVESPEVVMEWLERKGEYIYLAKLNQQVVGALRGRRGTGIADHACEITIAVSSDYRRQGIAKSLVIYGLSDLKNNGIKVARAQVFSDNKPSLNTLLGAGFSITGSVLKHHFDHYRKVYVDDIILMKDLV